MDISARHEGRIAIVTGAAPGEGGIGPAIAQRLVAEGATVLLADLDPAVAATAGALASAGRGATVEHFVGDLSDEATVQRLVDHAIARWGRIDVLVNNAGGGVIRPFLEHDAASLQATVGRNLWTAVWGCHKVLPHMVARRYGRIVNIGADSVRTGLYNHAGYNAAKGGVHGLTTGLAREFAEHDITVNTVAPSAVETPKLASLRESKPEVVRKYLGVIPKGRGATLEEVAGLVSYLASVEAGFVTGQVVSINGGSAML
jgi:2,3-dihydroxy-2,3-dihydro-p-cumate dehydrogenase